MVTAFCPGHITCFFSPAGDPGGEILRRGSLGAGIRISLGAEVEVNETSGSSVNVTLDGNAVEALVTESVFNQVAPGRGFEVIVNNQLPCGEGFGMSAAGAIASALCLSEIIGYSEQEAFEIAHRAEIAGGGGLGDVSAIRCLAHQPVRVKPGLPPYGSVIGTDVEFPHLTLAVLGPKMNTGVTLGNKTTFNAIQSAGRIAVEKYVEHPTTSRLYELSNSFSVSAGVECESVTEALEKLRGHGFNAAMCMLGNSLFTDAPLSDVENILGEGGQYYACSSTDRNAMIIRKA